MKKIEIDVVKQRGNNGGGVTGRGFIRGKSGNPKGRPKRGFAISDILNELGDELTESKSGEMVERRRAMLEQVYQRAMAGESWAVHFVADRTEGRSIERVITHESMDELVIE